MSKFQDLKKAMLAYAAVLRSLRAEANAKFEQEDRSLTQLSMDLRIPRQRLSDFMSGSRALMGDGCALPALCDYIGYSDKKRKSVLEIVESIPGDKYLGAVLFNDDAIETLIDIHEGFANIGLPANYMVFARSFGEQESVVLKCLNWNAEGISQLEDIRVNHVIIDRLMDDELHADVAKLFEQEEAGKIELSRRIKEILEGLSPRPSFRAFAEMVGSSSTVISYICSYERARKDVALETMQRIYSEACALSQAAEAPSVLPSVAPVHNVNIKSADMERLLQLIGQLEPYYDSRASMSEALGLPSRSLNHLYRGSVSPKRYEQVMKRAQELLAEKSAGQQTPSNGKPHHSSAVPLTPADGEPDTIATAMMASLEATARALKIYLGQRPNTRFSYSQQVMAARIIATLFASVLSDADVQSLIAGVPLDDRDRRRLSALLHGGGS